VPVNGEIFWKNESSLQSNEGRLGNICGPLSFRNGCFRIARLEEGRYAKTQGSDNQRGSSVEQPAGEEGEFGGIFNKIGVRFLLLPLRMRYALSLSSFIFALCIGLWGWINFYNERRLLGTSLIFGVYGLGCCGFWLLYPHLLGAPF